MSRPSPRGRAGQRLLKAARPAYTDALGDARPMIVPPYEGKNTKGVKNKKEKKHARD